MNSFTPARPSVVLIGMPGAGKSTLGRALAHDRGLAFIDTDQLIEAQAGKPLQQLLDELGYQKLRALEGEVIAHTFFAEPCVIATGGSAVYSFEAMAHLKATGVCVYLAISLATVEARVTNFATRGFAAEPGHTLAEVYRERQSLYEKYADLTLVCDELSPEQALKQLKALLP